LRFSLYELCGRTKSGLAGGDSSDVNGGLYRKLAIFDSVVFLSRTATVEQRVAVVMVLHSDGRVVPGAGQPGRC